MAKSLLDFVELQTLALPPAPELAESSAAPEPDVEESAAAVDLAATLARAARHEDALRTAGANPHGSPAEYEAYVREAVDGLGLANFTGAEVVAPHKRVTGKGVKNTLPPLTLLPRLLVRLVVTQRARALLGSGIRLTSLYRSPAYNRAIGGASLSQHRVCTAVDEVPLSTHAGALYAVHESMHGVRIKLTPEQEKTVARVARDAGVGVLTGSVYGEPFNASALAFDGKGFSNVGGLGRYSGFCHFDVRGIKTRWRG